jgi:hypothetical protein
MSVTLVLVWLLPLQQWQQLLVLLMLLTHQQNSFLLFCQAHLHLEGLRPPWLPSA